MNGSLLRIERTSIHDGQGLRTVLFLKGCPLRCRWCSTPESQRSEPEKGYASSRCRGCGACVAACPAGALSLGADGVVTDSSLCERCFRCVAVCPHGAHKRYGSHISVAEAVREIAKDEVFFFHSGGGVTISGGEPLMQPAFVAEVLRECRERGIHTAMETSLHAPWESLAQVLPFLGTLFVDMKQTDAEAHRAWVGPSNALIQANLLAVDQSAYPVEVVVRIPMVPGANDSDANLTVTAEFCRGLRKLKEIELLPYHRLGMETYRNLGLAYTLRDVLPPSRERIVERGAFLAGCQPGVPVRVGGGFA